MSPVDSVEGVRRLHQHIDGCYCAARGGEWCITDRDRPWDWDRKKNGYRGGGSMWWRFTCNDISCDAILLVRWDVLDTFLNDLGKQAETLPVLSS